MLLIYMRVLGHAVHAKCKTCIAMARNCFGIAHLFQLIYNLGLQSPLEFMHIVII